ncbi:hypothetical protein ES332_D11G009400v1 [Gossypium tomentosum]|uniref:Post-GPI attachment to proteins factor 3 n=1 Tax=Gossypium tomentosum TaxID=34277 RepID=A0A5D2IHN4_GOSTO|nr:hypothetical protein ES332_D11G009400v1 [Gossypium tomentosum]
MNQIARSHLIMFLFALSFLVPSIEASEGDADPIYKTCLEDCEKSGCVGEMCFQHCKFSSDGKPIDGPWYLQEPLYQKWKQWDCRSDCRYHCMIAREQQRWKLGGKPIKYHGKWPFQRVYAIQEPAAVAFSAISLAIQFHGWLSFFILLNYKLPLRPDKKTYYEYTGLFHIYAILAMNFWFWSAVCHTRDVELTEKLDYSSAVALVGFSFILTILRTFDVRDEASRVMVAAPLIAFVMTHILYLNFYKLDYGLNTKVCMAMGVANLLIWGVWAGITSHPSRWKVWLFNVGGTIALLLEIYDFPPYKGFIDAHALWHAANIPLAYISWSFVRDDAVFRTSTLLKKTK